MSTELRPAPSLLRWAGGKRGQLKHYGALLDELFPGGFRGRYFEPFFGSGAVYFSLIQQEHFAAEARQRTEAWAVLNDASAPVAGFWWAVQREPRALHSYLPGLCSNGMAYNDVREAYNAHQRSGGSADDLSQAARFLYLNRTGFNGLWRVNRNGAYNVPEGKFANGPSFPNRADLCAAADALRGAAIRNGDFDGCVSMAGAGDLIYADPPYGGAEGDRGFVAYTPGGFTAHDQQRLVRALGEAVQRGARVVLANGDFPGNAAAYRRIGLQVRLVDESRAINSKTSARKGVPCLLAWG